MVTITDHLAPNLVGRARVDLQLQIETWNRRCAFNGMRRYDSAPSDPRREPDAS